MTFYLLETGDFETSGPFYSKAELIDSLEQFDADDVDQIAVSELVKDEGTFRDVTADIAREMVDATEWHFDGSYYNDYRDTKLCPFIIHHAEFYAQDVAEEAKSEARTVASDQAVFSQAVA